MPQQQGEETEESGQGHSEVVRLSTQLARKDTVLKTVTFANYIRRAQRTESRVTQS